MHFLRKITGVTLLTDYLDCLTSLHTDKLVHRKSVGDDADRGNRSRKSTHFIYAERIGPQSYKTG